MKLFAKQKWLIGIMMVICLSLGFSSGHASNLGQVMSEFDLNGWAYCFTSSSSDYIHEFNKNGMWLQGIATGSATCGQDSIILGCLYNGNWILIKDTPTASICMESVLYWGVYPSKTYTWVNSVGSVGTSQLYECATGGDQIFNENEFGEIGERKSICLVDDYGAQYNLDISSAIGGKKINGTAVGTCDYNFVVTGMIQGDYFSFYVDIRTDDSCNEGYLVIGDVATKSGHWINDLGFTGTITFTSCASASDQISTKPPPWSK